MKPLWLALGWISFVLGVIGAFLPVIPTTPFLILAAFLFSQSSPRVHAWLLSLPFAGAAIEEWSQHRIIRVRAKILCSLMIILSLAALWMFSPVSVVLKSILTILLSSVLAFVLTRKSSFDL